MCQVQGKSVSDVKYSVHASLVIVNTHFCI